MGVEIFFLVAVLILSVIAHEVAHGYAANWLGDPTARLAGRLTINPIPHVDPIGSIIVPALLVLSQTHMLFGWAKPVPYNPHNLRNQRWGEAIVAVAGPATNLALALLFAAIVHLIGGSMPLSAVFAAQIVMVNLFLGLLNLLPIPPLDGFTVLRGILPFSLAYRLRGLEEQVQSLGAMGIFLVLILFTLFAGPFRLLVEFVYGLLI